MGGNHAVMEVKSARAVRSGAPKDLNTLAVRVGYERAIYLVYGEKLSDHLVERVAKVAATMKLPIPIEL